MILLFAFVLGVTVVEALGLILWHRRTGRGCRPVEVICWLAAGGLLCVAALLALQGAWWGWVGLSLAGAGVAHGFDLGRRLHTIAADERRPMP